MTDPPDSASVVEGSGGGYRRGGRTARGPAVGVEYFGAAVRRDGMPSSQASHGMSMSLTTDIAQGVRCARIVNSAPAGPSPTQAGATGRRDGPAPPDVGDGRTARRRTGLGETFGNLTSQFLANVYLHPLDHLVKHKLRVRS